MINTLKLTLGKRLARTVTACTATRRTLTLTIARPSSVPTLQRTYATSTTPTSTSFDPQATAAQEALTAGTTALEEGDLEEAEKCYSKSLMIKATTVGHYNLGVVQYQRQNLPGAILSFLSSLDLSPPLPPSNPDESTPPTPASLVLSDTHQNLGAAYILSVPSRADLALEHLQKALELTPDDGEICFNLAAVLEALGEDEEALVAYGRADKLGIERSKINIRNLGAKLLGKRREEEAAEAKAAKEGKGTLGKVSAEQDPSSKA